MPWNLEIHHLDIDTVGDATVIIARHVGVPALTKTILIDAGMPESALIVHAYLANLGNPVDVIVVTHYDKDHLGGIYELLNTVGTNIYDNAIIYDQGQPPHYPPPKRKADGTIDYLRNDYLKYIRALNNKPQVVRATLLVNSYDIVGFTAAWDHTPAPLGLAIPGPGWLDANFYNGVPPPGGGPNVHVVAPVVGQPSLPPDWLLGKEIMWGNGGDNRAGRPAFAQVIPAPPVGFPTLTCIAANKWTLQNPGPNSYVSAVNVFDGPNPLPPATIAELESSKSNAKCLGFILQFNQFKYYIAGDIEQHQEDGYNNRNTNPPTFKNGVLNYVNGNNSRAGRVLIVKASHHGSASATSRRFVDWLRPSAAIISCSTDNQHEHPAQKTENVLDGYPEVPINYEFIPRTSYVHPKRPPAPPNKPVKHYLTGFGAPNAGTPYSNNPTETFRDRTFGGDASYTAGSPFGPPGPAGHIAILISENESNTPVNGLLYRGLLTTIDTIDAQLHNAILPAAKITIADEGASFGVYAAVSSVVGASINSGIGAIDAAAYVGRDENNTSIVEAAAALPVLAAAITSVRNGVTNLATIDPVVLNLLGAGTAEAIGNAVNGANAAAITAAAGAAGANAVAANAAGFAGYEISQRFGNAAGGFAAAAAIGAVYGDLAAGTTAGQASAVAAAIGAETAESIVGGVTAVQMVDAIFYAATAAGLPNNTAALAGAVAAVCFFDGQVAEIQNAVFQALQRGGIAPVTATAQALAARQAADLTVGGNSNDFFRVRFHDDNPAYTAAPPPLGANPRTIVHTS